MRISAWVLGLVLAACPAVAQQSRDAARGQLFDGRATLSIQRHAFLTDRDIATMREIPNVAQIKYYGAFAAAPDAGFAAEETTAAFNFHDLESARRAALRGCEARRSGGAPCVVAADVVPRGYAPGRSLTLSQDASAAVRGRALRQGGGTLAASPSTGLFGIGADDGAAVAACRNAGGAADCAVAVR